MKIRVYYCPKCKDAVYRIDHVAMIVNKCGTCSRPFDWVEGDAEEVASYVGIPVDQWVDLTQC